MLHQNNVNGSSQLFSSFPLQLQPTQLQPNVLRQEGWNVLSQPTFTDTIGGRHSGYSSYVPTQVTVGTTQPFFSTRQTPETYNMSITGNPFVGTSINPQLIPFQGITAQQINPSLIGSAIPTSYVSGQQQVNPALFSTAATAATQANPLAQAQLVQVIFSLAQATTLTQPQVAQALWNLCQNISVLAPIQVAQVLSTLSQYVVVTQPQVAQALL